MRDVNVQRLEEEVNVADVNGQDAYRRAVAVVRRRQGLTSARSLGPIAADVTASAV